jgi:hypothetical protein
MTKCPICSEDALELMVNPRTAEVFRKCASCGRVPTESDFDRAPQSITNPAPPSSPKRAAPTRQVSPASTPSGTPKSGTEGAFRVRLRIEELATGEKLDAMAPEVQVSYLIETRNHPAFTREVCDVPLSARLAALRRLSPTTLELVKAALERAPERTGES